MLQLFPKNVPPLSVLLADIGNPCAQALAGALGVSPRTVQRWIATDDAPLSCRLALFYLTRWGRSQVNAQAENDAQIFRTSHLIAQADAARRTRDVQRLLATGDFGTANDPLVDLAPVVAGLPAVKSGS